MKAIQLNHTNQRSRRLAGRCGYSVIELMVSMSVLLIGMAGVAKLYFRLDLIWTDVSHHRIAINELSNQLERITLLPMNDVQPALEHLELSPQCKRTLVDASISGNIRQDRIGTSVLLKIQWQREHLAQTAQLVGWLNPVSNEHATGTGENAK